KMPVVSFCVEQGRWSQRGKETANQFASSPFQFISRDIRLNGGGLGQFGTPPSGQLGGTLGSGISGQSAAGLGFGGGFAQLGGHLGLQGRSQLGGFGMQGGVWQEVERVQTRLQDKVGDKVQSEQSRTSLALTLENKVVTEKAAGAIRRLLP